MCLPLRQGKRHSLPLMLLDLPSSGSTHSCLWSQQQRPGIFSWKTLEGNHWQPRLQLKPFFNSCIQNTTKTGVASLLQLPTGTERTLLEGLLCSDYVAWPGKAWFCLRGAQHTHYQASWAPLCNPPVNTTQILQLSILPTEMSNLQENSNRKLKALHVVMCGGSQVRGNVWRDKMVWHPPPWAHEPGVSPPNTAGAQANATVGHQPPPQQTEHGQQSSHRNSKQICLGQQAGGTLLCVQRTRANCGSWSEHGTHAHLSAKKIAVKKLMELN